MYANVLLEIKSKSVDKTFTYILKEEQQYLASVGMRVLVPFGNQTLQGYILELVESIETEYEMKEIITLIDDECILNPELLKLGQYIKEKTLCSLSNAYSTMLPSALKAKKNQTVHKKFATFLRLNISYADAILRCKNKIQEEIISLFDCETFLAKEKANEISTSATKTLIKNNILKEEQEEMYRFQVDCYEKDTKKQLNEEQMVAFASIQSHFDEAKTFLLHGVTGSGKTEIYMQVIEEVLKKDQQAIVLVPEISLTPQFVHNFAKRFSDDIAVLHSGLSNGEKYDEWRKIMRNEVKIVIGARSAIFAPLSNIGVIIIDEEHSDSYKQENSPKYRVKDMAEFRSRYHQCPVILGSATPTLESMARAKKGVYELLTIKNRVNESRLPVCEIVDMAKEMKVHHPIISRLLEFKIHDRLEKQEQILILLNRRGFSTTITCSSCGFTYRCPHCDITLTYHKSSKNLRCHYCGYSKYIDEFCPECHEESLNYYGLGTEKLETYLKEKFPTARMIRMDTDTTSKKGSHEKITESFRKREYDILIGTQMISKGLDFPNVSLVGIVGADITLNIPDFRSGERTFDLLYQASGRAGRGDILGEVVLETFNPDNYVLNCVKENDYEKFYQYEMNIRRTLKYPPFYYLANLKIKSKEYELASKESRKVADYLKKHLESSSIVLGPTISNVFRVNGIYHFEIMIKYRFDKNLQETLKDLDQLFLINKKVDLDIDLSY